MIENALTKIKAPQIQSIPMSFDIGNALNELKTVDVKKKEKSFLDKLRSAGLGLFDNIESGIFNNLSKNFSKDLTGGLSSGWGAIAGLALDRTDNQDKEINSTDVTTGKIRNAAIDMALASGDPVSMAIGTGLKFIDRAGGFSDSSEGLGGFTDAANAVGSFIPGIGWIGRNTESLDKYSNVEESGAFGQMLRSDDYNTATKNQDGTFLFGAGKANAVINEQNRRLALADDIIENNKENADAAVNTMPLVHNKLIGKKRGIHSLMTGINAVRAKEGGKLFTYLDNKPLKKQRGGIINQNHKHYGSTIVEHPNFMYDYNGPKQEFNWEYYTKQTSDKPSIHNAKQFETERKGVVTRYNAFFNALKKRYGNIYSEKHIANLAGMLTAQSLQESGYELPKDNNLYGHKDEGKIRSKYSTIEGGLDYHLDLLDEYWKTFKDAKSLRDYVHSLYQGERLYNAHDSEPDYYNAIRGVVNRMQYYLNNSGIPMNLKCGGKTTKKKIRKCQNGDLIASYLKDVKNKKSIYAQKGTKLNRSMEDLVKYVNSNKDVPFVKRLLAPSIQTITLPNGENGSHLLGYAEADGKTFVFPMIQDIDNKLHYFDNWEEAFDSAFSRGDIIEMSPEEAELFTKNYKKYYSGFNKVNDQKTISSYKKGGNIIPEGALHARKHNLEETNEDLKGNITNKGIPVISEEGGKIVQHAEIERHEIIFGTEATNQLEKYLKEYNSLKEQDKDVSEIELECGKFLCKEILKNTTDKTGLIKTVE